MRIRETDPPQDEAALDEIKQARSSKNAWIQAGIAALLAGASALGTYQVTTGGSEKQPGHESLLTKIEKNAEYNKTRWDEIAKSMEKEYLLIETLRKTVETMLGQCAAVRERDDSMQRQIEAGLKRQERLEMLLFEHLGLSTNGHSKP